MGAKRTNDLLKALRGTPVAQAISSVPTVERKPPMTTGRGKPMNLYLHPEDTQRIRSLAAYLTGQGFRVSDSQVVKAALRTASADSSLLSAYEQAVTTDQRFKRPKNAREE